MSVPIFYGLSVCVSVCLSVYLYNIMPVFKFQFSQKNRSCFSVHKSTEWLWRRHFMWVCCASFMQKFLLWINHPVIFSIKITGDQLSNKNNNINNNNNNILINRNMTNSLTTTTSYNNKQQTRVRYRMFYKISPFFVFCSLLLCFWKVTLKMQSLDSWMTGTFEHFNI